MKNTCGYKKWLLGMLLLTAGCTKNFDAINTNTGSYNQDNFNPEYVLTSVQLAYTGSSDFSYDTWRANLIYCSTMIQGFSSVINYWAGDKYQLNTDYTAAYWGFALPQQPPEGNGGDGAYPEQVKLIVDLVQFTKNKPAYHNLYQVARIMRALVMERITDLYGDVPYFDAGMGYYTNNYYPVYNHQQDIYTDLLKEISDATASLDPSAAPPTGDAFYKGNIVQWQRFGYTLLLRVAMRLTKADPATALRYVQLASGHTMTSNDDNAYVMGDASGGRRTINRNSQVLLGDGGEENVYVKWSATFINLLKSTNDPRLAKIAVTNPVWKDGNAAGGNADPAVQKGMPNGKDLTGVPGRDISTDSSFTAMSDYSSPAPALISRNGPTFILTYAEAELLLAEAAVRWGLGDAETHYNQGVAAAITYLSQYDRAATLSADAALSYLKAHPYDAANALACINTQYWIHTNTMLDFYESWSNWRRSGYPVLKPVMYPNNATNGTIPRRFPYPLSESNTNPINYQNAHNAVPGGDLLTSRVWWDKQ